MEVVEAAVAPDQAVEQAFQVDQLEVIPTLQDLTITTVVIIGSECIIIQMHNLLQQVLSSEFVLEL